MEWTIPGTVLTGAREDAGKLRERFSALFLGGGIVLSQVCAITGLEAYTVQNWVKRGFLPPPKNKRYNLNQLCRVMTIQALKDGMVMEDICKLLEYVNGALDDEGDDLIDDATLYFTFVHLAALDQETANPAAMDQNLRSALAGYREPAPGAKQRVERVLRIMLTAWLAAQLRSRARVLMDELNAENERRT